MTVLITGHLYFLRDSFLEFLVSISFSLSSPFFPFNHFNLNYSPPCFVTELWSLPQNEYASLHVLIIISHVTSDDLCSHQLFSTYLTEFVFAHCPTLWSSRHQYISQLVDDHLQVKKPMKSARIFVFFSPPLHFLTSDMGISLVGGEGKTFQTGSKHS